MQKGPFVDAEFEVVADAHPTEEELAERDRKLAAVHAELKRTDLKGWRLWGAILLTILVLWPIFFGYNWLMMNIAKFIGLLGAP